MTIQTNLTKPHFLSLPLCVWRGGLGKSGAYRCSLVNRWLIRNSQLNGKTKGCKDNNVRMRATWLQHHGMENGCTLYINLQKNVQNIVSSPLKSSFKLNLFLVGYLQSLFVGLCKEGVWVVKIQDIGWSCFCPPLLWTLHTVRPHHQHIKQATQCSGHITSLCLPKPGQAHRGYSQCIECSWIVWGGVGYRGYSIHSGTGLACKRGGDSGLRQWRRAPGLVMGSHGGVMACGYWVLTPPFSPVLYCIALGINPSLTRAQLCAFRDLQLTATNPTVIYIC